MPTIFRVPTIGGLFCSRSRSETACEGHACVVFSAIGKAVFGVLQQLRAGYTARRSRHLKEQYMKTIPQEIHFAAPQH